MYKCMHNLTAMCYGDYIRRIVMDAIEAGCNIFTPNNYTIPVYGL